MIAAISEYIVTLLLQIAELDAGVILLAVLTIAAVIVLDAVTLSARRAREETGISKSASTVSIDGTETYPVRLYVSEMQGLAGRPDAIIIENGALIPVERKPLANKLRDRYVAQLLVYMRLVEEFEGKRPPYGYLILGPSCRKIRIDNTEKRQAWLQGLIDEMRGILDGVPARPEPHPKKCQRCDVREACAAKWQASNEIQLPTESKVGALKIVG